MDEDRRTFCGQDVLGDGGFVGRTFCILDVFRKDVLWKNVLEEGRLVVKDAMLRGVLY